MYEYKVEDCCIEDKQSTAALASSISENSGGVTVKSYEVCSPAPTSPAHWRATGPIRRAKDGWTPDDVSSFPDMRTTGPIRRAKDGLTPDDDDTLRRIVAAYRGSAGRK